MGLNALAPADWLWRDEHFAAETEQRRELMAIRRDEVHAMLPGAEPAARELLAMVQAHVVEHHDPGALGTQGDTAPPLLALGQLAQEDFCVLQRQADGRYALQAALLCFPAHWRLAEKLGRPLAMIHAPVPGLNERLGAAVDRFLGSLAVERPVWRANWSVVESPTLFHPQPREPATGVSAANAGDRLWLRVERQTLRRLPQSRAIVFTIRTLVRPLGEIVRPPGVARAMADRIREIDGGMAGYKGIPALREPLLAYLDALA